MEAAEDSELGGSGIPVGAVVAVLGVVAVLVITVSYLRRRALARAAEDGERPTTTYRGAGT